MGQDDHVLNLSLKKCVCLPAWETAKIISLSKNLNVPFIYSCSFPRQHNPTLIGSYLASGSVVQEDIAANTRREISDSGGNVWTIMTAAGTDMEA